MCHGLDRLTTRWESKGVRTAPQPFDRVCQKVLRANRQETTWIDPLPNCHDTQMRCIPDLETLND